MRSYEAARGYFSVMAFFAWCVIALGTVAVLIGLGAAGQMGRGFGMGPSPAAVIATIIPGAALAFAGFLGLVFCQMGRAGVDTAEYAQQSLKIARESLEISKQSLKQQSAVRDPSYAALQATKHKLRSDADTPASASYGDKPPQVDAPDTPHPEPVETYEHNGRTITFDGQYYHFAKMTFAELDFAKSYINQLGVSETTKIGSATRS